MADFEDVGLSLFKGMDTLQINQDSENLDEEASEEQRRRNEELRSLLKQACADLSFNDDEDEEDDDEDDDSYGEDDSEDDGHSNNNSRHSRCNKRRQNEIQGFSQRVEQEVNRILPPRPVTEGSVMFPEHNKTPQQWLSPPINVLPPAVYQESGESLQGTVETSLDSRMRATSGGSSSVNSGPTDFGNAQRAGPIFHNSSTVDPNEVYREAGYNDTDQLRVLFEVRTREVQRLTQELDAMKAEAAAEVDGLHRRIMTCEAEKNSVQLQLTNAQTLLVDSKARVKELETEVDLMKKNVNNLEGSKKQMEMQLAAAQSSVVELQHKVLLLERSRLGDSQEVLRQLEERHRSEVDKLYSQMREKAAQFHEQEREATAREGRLREQNREQERLLVEKGEAVAALARQLEDAQRNVGRQVSLESEVARAHNDCQQLTKRLADAHHEIDTLKTDLKQYEVLDSFGLLSGGGDASANRSVRPNSVGSHNNSFHAKLRHELQRSLIGQKVKREEIQKLQQQLKDRDQQLAIMRRQQELYLEEANKFKDEVDKLYTQLGNRDNADGCANVDMEKALQETNLHLSAKQAELDKAVAELHSVNTKLVETEKKLEEAEVHLKSNNKEEFFHFHEKTIAKMKMEFDEQNTALQFQLQKSREECDRVKQMYIEVCGSKELLLQTLDAERSSWIKERAEWQEKTTHLETRLDLYTCRVSEEIDKAKQAAAAALMTETIKRPEIKSVSVQATSSPILSPTPVNGSCPSCEALRQQVSFLESRMKGLTEELCRRQTDLRDSRAQAANLQRDVAELSANKNTLKEQLIQLEKKLKNMSVMEADIKNKESELVLKVEQQSALEKELQSHQKAVREANQKVSELETKVEALKSKLAKSAEVEKTVQEQYAELTRLQNLVDSLKKELVTCQTDSERHNCDTDEVVKMKEKVEKMEQEMNEAKKDATEASIRLTAELLAARNLCEQLADKLKESRSDRRDAETCTDIEYPDLDQINTRHRLEVETIKDQTVEYFANQVMNLQEQHRASLAKAEQLHVEGLQTARLLAMEAREQATAARLQKENAEKHLSHLQKTLNEVKSDLAQLRAKYHTAKKVVQDYKVWAQKREEQCRDEWTRLEEGYRNSLLKLQQRMDQMLSQQGKQSADNH